MAPALLGVLVRCITKTFPFSELFNKWIPLSLSLLISWNCINNRFLLIGSDVKDIKIHIMNLLFKFSSTWLSGGFNLHFSDLSLTLYLTDINTLNCSVTVFLFTFFFSCTPAPLLICFLASLFWKLNKFKVCFIQCKASKFHFIKKKKVCCQ